MTIAIGASVLEEQQPTSRATDWRFDHGGQDPAAQQRPALPSLLRTVSDNHPRLLLLQPTTTSNDMSLVMDLAISLASAEPCRCAATRRPGSSSSAAGSFWNPGTAGGNADGCDNCVGATLIVPVSIHNAQDSSFPLLCRRQEDSAANLTLNLTQQRQEVNFQTQQQQALQRIQVRHVTSLTEIWEYLLQLPGLPLDQQPLGGILLCGLDQLVTAAAPPGSHQDAAGATILMTQTGSSSLL